MEFQELARDCVTVGEDGCLERVPLLLMHLEKRQCLKSLPEFVLMVYIETQRRSERRLPVQFKLVPHVSLAIIGAEISPQGRRRQRNVPETPGNVSKDQCGTIEVAIISTIGDVFEEGLDDFVRKGNKPMTTNGG